MAIDHPDWLQQVAGGLRYIGTIPRAGGTLDVPLLPQDRALLILAPGTSAEGLIFSLSVFTVTANVITYNDLVAGGQIAVAYVNPAVDTLWRVSGSGGGAGFGAWYVFADTTPLLTRITNAGAQGSATSIPVALATDQIPLPVDMRIGGVGVSQANPMYVRLLRYDPGQTIWVVEPATSLVDWLPLAARTATQTLVVPLNAGHRGIALTIHITAAAGGSVSLALLGYDAVIPAVTRQLYIGPAIVAAGDSAVVLYPGISTVLAPNATGARVNDVMPATTAIQILHNNANPITYQAKYELLV